MKQKVAGSADFVRDQALIQRIQARDEAALSSLYDNYGPAVYWLAYRITNHAQEAEDVVLECFWQVWQQAHLYDDARGQVLPWLITIARSRALDHRRTLHRQATCDLTWKAQGNASPGSENPEDTLWQTEQVHRLRTALQHLPSKQREVLELAYYWGLSQTEIAAHLGEPLGTIKTRSRLALTKLRATILPPAARMPAPAHS